MENPHLSWVNTIQIGGFSIATSMLVYRSAFHFQPAILDLSNSLSAPHQQESWPVFLLCSYFGSGIPASQKKEGLKKKLNQLSPSRTTGQLRG